MDQEIYGNAFGTEHQLHAPRRALQLLKLSPKVHRKGDKETRTKIPIVDTEHLYSVKKLLVSLGSPDMTLARKALSHAVYGCTIRLYGGKM